MPDPTSELDEDELVREALAAGDPDQEIPPDALPLMWGANEAADGAALLPSWYMPAPVRTSSKRRHRVMAYAFVGSLVAINLSGLCVTYGHLVLA